MKEIEKWQMCADCWNAGTHCRASSPARLFALLMTILDLVRKAQRGLMTNGDDHGCIENKMRLRKPLFTSSQPMAEGAGEEGGGG